MQAHLNHNPFHFSPFDAGAGADPSTSKPTNGRTNAEQASYIEELQKLNGELRQARRAALNLMEDAILSKEALRQSEEKYRTKLEQEVRDRTAELNASRDLLQATIDSSLDVIQLLEAVRDKTGKIVDFTWAINNRKAAEQNGDVIGKSLLQQNPGVVKSGVFGKMVQVMETGAPQEGEQYYNYEQFDGWFYQAIVKSGDGVVMTTRDITEEKKIQQQIKESKELLQATMNASTEMIQVFEAVRNEQREIVDFKWILNNYAAEKVYGDIIGKSLLEHNPGVVEEGIFDTLKKVVETGIPDQSERHYVHEQFNGWFYQSTVQLGDGVATTTSDITQRKTAEQEILRLKEEIAQQATSRYYSLFNSIDEGFGIIEMLCDEAGQATDYRFVEVNKSFERQTGLENVVGKTGKELTPDGEPYWMETYSKVAQTGEAIRFENYHQPTKRWYESYASRLGGAGSRQVAIVFNDITERKRHEQQQRYLLQLSDTLHALSDPVEIQAAATQTAMNYLNADRCYYVEIEGENAMIRRDASRGELASIAGVYPLKDLPVFKAFFLNPEPIVVSDVAKTELLDEPLRQLCMDAQIIAFINLPIIKNGSLAGRFCITQCTQRIWKDIEIELATETAEHTWSAVERARAEEAMRESEKRLRTLADAVPQVIWTNNPEGKANYFNRRWYEYTGLTDEQSEGPGWQAIVHPDDAPASVEKWNKALAAEEIFDTEYRLRRADGSYRWFIGRNVPLKNAAGKVTGWFGSATDIEELKIIQEELSRSEARLKITMETATDYAIITMDTERRIERWSRGAAEIFGYREAEVIGRSADLIFTEQDRKAGAPQQEMETARDAGYASDERWHRRKDGSRFYVSGVMRPIQNDYISGYVKVARDMTRQQLFTEELHRLVDERTLELQQTNESLQQFATIAAHDLQEPLRKLRLFTSVLQRFREKLPDEGQELLSKIYRTSERMGQLISEVLQYSKIAYNAEEFLPTDLDQILQNVLTDLELLIKETGATILYEDSLPEIEAVSPQINQLFYNLLTNALKFRRKGRRPIVRISCRPLSPEEVRTHAGFQPHNLYIEMTVADNGIGFDKQFSEQIFRIFERLHSADEYEGTGVGLALCKKIAENHHGHIFATSKEGEGAVFHVVLPLKHQGRKQE